MSTVLGKPIERTLRLIRGWYFSTGPAEKRLIVIALLMGIVVAIICANVFMLDHFDGRDCRVKIRIAGVRHAETR